MSKENSDSLSHTRWNYKYHIVFAPKFRRQNIYGKLKIDIGKILRSLCERKNITGAGGCTGEKYKKLDFLLDFIEKHMYISIKIE